MSILDSLAWKFDSYGNRHASGKSKLTDLRSGKPLPAATLLSSQHPEWLVNFKHLDLFFLSSHPQNKFF